MLEMSACQDKYEWLLRIDVTRNHNGVREDMQRMHSAGVICNLWSMIRLMEQLLNYTWYVHITIPNRSLVFFILYNNFFFFWGINSVLYVRKLVGLCIRTGKLLAAWFPDSKIVFICKIFNECNYCFIRASTSSVYLQFCEYIEGCEFV